MFVFQELSELINLSVKIKVSIFESREQTGAHANNILKIQSLPRKTHKEFPLHEQ
jgi:hypothetical protein